jgi:hypothetical protein
MTTVIEKSTGEKKTALYETTPKGNKRFNVDGKFYSDKQFNQKFGIVDNNEPLVWKSHVRQLFEEVLTNKACWILKQPLSITLSILGEMAQHAAEIKDEKMIGYFCRLALYTFSDPTDKDYDEERAAYYIGKTTN